ncbi:response regulator transcription factor [Jatrophihabitans telluris]|uniref:Response regulator transcription factor n=1 Tax=Jatrophihabitans telluris TaxID=2038343 RepID=A0ABY4QRK3_9ACTN|nr:response regulator transcription factor [Jatrophihabitans telluris]UQX86613.1 response regulator transcription factor [Jatrophihabitans telluris]
MTDRVLVAEDDRAIRESITRALRLEGYEVDAVADGAAALVRAAEADLLLLDVMMPGVDGLTVCKVLRGQGNDVPILIVTARTETADRVSGLDAGADDYVLKPFELVELLARMRALLRRSASSRAALAAPGTELAVADLRLDLASRRAWRGSREIGLSRTEFDLLELLMRNEGVVLAHATIYERIWSYDFGPESKNLTVYISYLRRKVDAEESVKLIHTVRGVGYTVRVP